MFSRLENLNYKEKLDMVGLLFLEQRRVRGKMREAYLALRITAIYIANVCFPMVGLSKTRGNRITMKESLNGIRGVNVSIQRVAGIWNELSDDVMERGIINMYYLSGQVLE